MQTFKRKPFGISSKPVAHKAFTFIEIASALAIVLLLAALVFSGSSYLRERQKRSRAEMEISAIAAALEDYKIEMGDYPQNVATNSLDSKNSFDPITYKEASLYLYEKLSGDRNLDGVVDDKDKEELEEDIPKAFFRFEKNVLKFKNGKVVSFEDPYENAYGYSTTGQFDPEKGHNPTYDLWSTGGDIDGKNQGRWITNW